MRIINQYFKKKPQTKFLDFFKIKYLLILVCTILLISPVFANAANCICGDDAPYCVENKAACDELSDTWFEQQSITCEFNPDDKCYDKDSDNDIIINVQDCQLSNISNCKLEDAISTLYNFGMGAGVMLTVVMIMVGGILWMMAGGSQERVSSAKSYITASLIGLVLLLTSFLILQTINPRLVNLQMPSLPNIADIPEFQTEGFTPEQIAQIEEEMKNDQFGCCIKETGLDDFCNKATQTQCDGIEGYIFNGGQTCVYHGRFLTKANDYECE